MRLGGSEPDRALRPVAVDNQDGSLNQNLPIPLDCEGRPDYHCDTVLPPFPLRFSGTQPALQHLKFHVGQARRSASMCCLIAGSKTTHGSCKVEPMSGESSGSSDRTDDLRRSVVLGGNAVVRSRGSALQTARTAVGRKGAIWPDWLPNQESGLSRTSYVGHRVPNAH